MSEEIRELHEPEYRLVPELSYWDKFCMKVFKKKTKGFLERENTQEHNDRLHRAYDALKTLRREVNIYNKTQYKAYKDKELPNLIEVEEETKEKFFVFAGLKFKLKSICTIIISNKGSLRSVSNVALKKIKLGGYFIEKVALPEIIPEQSAFITLYVGSAEINIECSPYEVDRLYEHFVWSWQKERNKNGK